MAARRMKCDGCGKVKSDVMLCADDNLCRGCQVAIERELGRISGKSGATAGPSGATPKSTPASNAAAKKSASQAIASAGCDCGKPATAFMLSCDICAIVVHPACINIPDSAAKHLQALLTHIAWVCENCREQSRIIMQRLQSGQARLVEEVAELKVAVSDLQSALHTGIQPGQTTAKTMEQSVRKAVQSELSDKERRSRNIVVTGLAPDANVPDDALFLQLCESNLQSKPVIIRDRCRRLGKVVAGKIQPLLVTLSSSESARELLCSAKELRKSDDPVVRGGVYLNADLTAAERQLAYEQRVLRRQRTQQQSTLLSATAVPFTPLQSAAPTDQPSPLV